MVALAFTSRSIGKLIPKLSASVNASLSIPDHCFEIFPTSTLSSGVMIWNSTSPQMLYVHQGPTIFKISFSSASKIENEGLMQVQFCLTHPMVVPGGEHTSISCKQHGKQQLLQLNGRFRLITSWSALSLMIMLNGLMGPQASRMQQLLSSLALNTFCPNEFLIFICFGSRTRSRELPLQPRAPQTSA